MIKELEKMEGKPINYFSSTLNFGKKKASPPYSLSDKGRYVDPLSDREKIIYKEEADTAPTVSKFSKLFFEKNEATGALSTSSL